MGRIGLHWDFVWGGREDAEWRWIWVGVESNEVCMGWNVFVMVPINDDVMSLLDC